jgi:cytochrome c
MRVGGRVWIGCAIALGASLLLARVHPFGNPGFDAAAPAQGLMEHAAVPAEVRATLAAKCADCHSMQTRLPVYDRVAVRFAPVSWLIESDVVDGRSHMNLSQWESWSADEQEKFAAKIVEQMKARSMPPLQYRLIHRNAEVTDADVAMFTGWLHGMQSAEAVAATPKAAGDPVRGEAIFEKRCTGCHALNRNREGPRLGDVFGRTSGQVAGFSYSSALVKAHIVWNETTLEQWLTDTDALVPDNDMDFRVPRAQERLDLIAFLKKNAGQRAN